MPKEDKITEILEKIDKHNYGREYEFSNCSQMCEAIKKKFLAQARQDIIEEIRKRVVVERKCHIIWDKEKQFQCEHCSKKYGCKYIAFNKAIDLINSNFNKLSASRE